MPPHTTQSRYGGWALGDRQRAENRITTRLQRRPSEAMANGDRERGDSIRATPRQSGGPHAHPSHPAPVPPPRRRPPKRKGKGTGAASPSPHVATSFTSRFAPRDGKRSGRPSLIGSPEVFDTSMIFSGAAVYDLDSRGRRVSLQRHHQHHGRTGSKSPSPTPEVLGPSWLRNSLSPVPSPVPWRSGVPVPNTSSPAARDAAARDDGDGITGRVFLTWT